MGVPEVLRSQAFGSSELMVRCALSFDFRALSTVYFEP